MKELTLYEKITILKMRVGELEKCLKYGFNPALEIESKNRLDKVETIFMEIKNEMTKAIKKHKDDRPV